MVCIFRCCSSIFTDKAWVQFSCCFCFSKKAFFTSDSKFPIAFDKDCIRNLALQCCPSNLSNNVWRLFLAKYSKWDACSLFTFCSSWRWWFMSINCLLVCFKSLCISSVDFWYAQIILFCSVSDSFVCCRSALSFLCVNKSSEVKYFLNIWEHRGHMWASVFSSVQTAHCISVMSFSRVEAPCERVWSPRDAIVEVAWSQCAWERI